MKQCGEGGAMALEARPNDGQRDAKPMMRCKSREPWITDVQDMMQRYNRYTGERQKRMPKPEGKGPEWETMGEKRLSIDANGQW